MSRRWTQRCARMQNPLTKKRPKKKKPPRRGARQSMRVRDAVLTDAEQIHALIAAYSGDGTLLPRTLAEICENVRDFVVLEHDGRIIGCGALHLYGVHLAQIRSITVDPSSQSNGGGRRLVKALLAQAEKHKVTCVCLFTRIPEFFSRLGFTTAAHQDLPDKIHKHSYQCPRLYRCDEVAMVRGDGPTFAILPPPKNWLKIHSGPRSAVLLRKFVCPGGSLSPRSLPALRCP